MSPELSKYPTDSFYKFMAIAGLSIVIACILADVSLVNGQNQRVHDFGREIIDRQSHGAVPIDQYSALLLKQLSSGKEDVATLTTLLGVGTALGLLSAIFGLHRWHGEQRLRDRLLLADLQLKARELEAKPSGG